MDCSGKGGISRKNDKLYDVQKGGTEHGIKGSDSYKAVDPWIFG